ncbi:G protein-coupled receptor rhodopsin-like [Trinorchestia longiramus]|nr:G protein-coupled receptor rhodopsin-like [Trinorchestia longiramus]
MNDSLPLNATEDDSDDELLAPWTYSSPKCRVLRPGMLVVITLCYSVGIFGNLLALYIIAKSETKKYKKQTLLLRCLATNDLVALVGSCLQMYVTLYLGVGGRKWSCAVRVVLRVFGLGSGYVALAMAVERWLALSHPFFYQKNITPSGLLKFIFVLWGANATIICCPLLGFGLWYDESLPCPCSRYRDASRPVDVVYAYLIFGLGMVMCSVIVASNASVIKVLCHVGRRRNEPMRCSRASYALQNQSSFSQNSYRFSKKKDRPPDELEVKVDEDLPLVSCDAPRVNVKVKSAFKKELDRKNVVVECPSEKVGKVHEYSVLHDKKSSQVSETRQSTPVRAQDSGKRTLKEKDNVSVADASSSFRRYLERGSNNILRKSSLVSIGRRYKHATPEEISFAKLMTVLSVVFLVCWMPQFFTIPATQLKWFGEKPKIFRIADILIALNFVIDPYVYVILRRRHKQKHNYLHKCRNFCRSCTSVARSVTTLDRHPGQRTVLRQHGILKSQGSVEEASKP